MADNELFEPDFYFLDQSNMAEFDLSESELKDLVNSLTSKCCEDLQKTLSKLHNYFGLHKRLTLRTRSATKFYKIGGFTNILQLLSRPNPKWLEKAIDILAQCCRIDDCHRMTSSTEFFSLITSLFKFYYKNEKIQVSLCKTISHSYYQEEARTTFLDLDFDINSAIIDLLLYRQLSIGDHNTVTLTLVYLNQTPPLQEETIQTLLTKFNPIDNDLILKIIRTVDALMEDYYSACTEISAQQIRTTIGISNLVNYAQSSDSNLRYYSVNILTKISGKSNVIRREMGEAGMIPIYINRIRDYIYDYETVYGLCQLLRHVDNRNRIFHIVNGFETLISLLHRWDELDRDFYFISNQKYVINAIEQFFSKDEEYNESHIVKFLNLDLVLILVNILDNCVQNTETDTRCTKYVTRYIGQIIHILTVISSNHEFHFRFLNSTILDVLLRTWLSESYDHQLMRIENIVTPLLRSDVCFKDLILLQFPQVVWKIMDEYKFENINRLLTTGSESVKRTVALILPYILVTEVEVSGVYNLALELFLKNLADPFNDNFKVSLNIFFEICEKGQSSDIDSFSHEAHERDYCVLYEFDKDVHFILDDGEKVSANRSILIQSSDMFDAMLNGHFMEANQSEIRFKYASTEAFKLILHFLHGCTDFGETSCPVLSNAHYEFLFEASDMADRMVLMNLKSFILGIIAKKLTRYSAVSVCRYAQQNNYLSLLVDHLMKSSVGKNYKTDLFTIILSSDLNEHLINEIKLKIESLHFL